MNIRLATLGSSLNLRKSLTVEDDTMFLSPLLKEGETSFFRPKKTRRVLKFLKIRGGDEAKGVLKF